MKPNKTPTSAVLHLSVFVGDDAVVGDLSQTLRSLATIVDIATTLEEAKKFVETTGYSGGGYPGKVLKEIDSTGLTGTEIISFDYGETLTINFHIHSARTDLIADDIIQSHSRAIAATDSTAPGPLRARLQAVLGEEFFQAAPKDYEVQMFVERIQTADRALKTIRDLKRIYT